MQEKDTQMQNVSNAVSPSEGGEDITVYKTKTGWMAAVATEERYENGRIRYLRARAETRKEAVEKEGLLLEIKIKGNSCSLDKICSIYPEEPKNILFSDAAKKFLLVKKTEVRRSTLEGYKIIVEVHLLPFFKKKSIMNIDESDIYMYFAEKAHLSSTTLRHHHSVLSMILKSNNNYCIERVKRPKLSNFKPCPVRSLERLENLIEKLKGTTVYLPAFLAAITGMRMSEIAGLQWRDVDFNYKVIRVERTLHYKKGKREYYIEATKTKKSV